MGFGLTILAKFAKIFTTKQKFIVDKSFLFWGVINTGAIWVLFILANYLGIIDYVASIIFTAVGLVLVAYLVRISRMDHSNLFLWIFVIAITLYLIHNSDQQEIHYGSSSNFETNLTTKSNNQFEGIFKKGTEKFSKTLKSNCPQINVEMKFHNEGTPYETTDISGKTYDGWTIKGSANCRKGTKEGENLNKYYCGGYTYFFGMGNVNAYIEKTIISETGDIGKTYKYVIWNIYDENKNFVETRCLGDPDKFDQKQAEAFYNEMLKWN
ncbi:MAG: hypothetical protein Q8Q42_01110 [Nanoarchaeota archaeon]|nr:hypothetical protein [Nanoarchaeota archaeon]